VHLFGSGTGAANTRVKRLKACQVLQRVGDVVDVRLADIQLQRLVRLERDRGLLARLLVFGAQLATEDLGNGSLDLNSAGRLRSGCLLLGCNLKPAAVRRVWTINAVSGAVSSRVGLARLDNVSTVVVESSEEETQELFRILLRTSLHVIEAGKTLDGVVNVLWCEWVSVLLQLVVLEAQTKLVNRGSRVNHFEVAHEHYPGPVSNAL
jgi:hypothetical protein